LKFTENTKAEFQLADVVQHLKMTYSSLEEYGDDPSDSDIKIQNDSGYDLGPRRIICFSNLVVGADGSAAAENLGFSKYKKGWEIMSSYAPPTLPKSFDGPVLRKNGDSESESCMSAIKPSVGFSCLDFTIIYQYRLVIQPELEQSKWLRIVAYKSPSGKYIWHTRPTDERISECTDYVKK